MARKLSAKVIRVVYLQGMHERDLRVTRAFSDIAGHLTVIMRPMGM